MAKKNEVDITKEKTQKELLEEWGNEFKEDLTRELDDHIDKKVTLAVAKETEKVNKRIIREKTRKIIFRDITIILLLALSIYLLYLLKNAHYFDKYFGQDNSSKETTIVKENNEKKDDEEVLEPAKPTLEELTKEYGSLLDNLYLNESSEYINNLYNGEFTPEVKQYFTMNYIFKEGLVVDENYNVVDNNKFKTTYETIFNDSYVPTSFIYNDVNVRYITKLESYITDKIITENKTNIIKTITDIKVTEEEIIITTIEGIEQDNKVYNILTNKEVCETNKIANNTSNLNKLVYTFTKDKKLKNINK